MNSEQVKGKLDEVVGSVKRKTGEWTGNAPLEIKGLVQELRGEVEIAAGDAKAVLDEAQAEVRHKVEALLDRSPSSTPPRARS